MNVPEWNSGGQEGPPEPRSRFHTRLLLWIAAGGLMLAGSYYVPRTFAADSQEEPMAMPVAKVTVAAVELKTLVEHRELIGRVDARETAEIRARVAGPIDEVRFEAGSLVRRGEVLFVIDPRPYRAKFQLAAADVERARVRLLVAESEAKRSDQLLASKAISVEEAEGRSFRLAEARTELAAAEAVLESAKLDLDYTEVRSPLDGRISRALVTAGNLVTSEHLLGTVVSKGDVYVYADVDENTALTFDRLRREGKIGGDQGRVAVEMQVGDEEGFPHRGYVESVDNRVDPATGTLVYRMIFPNDGGDLIPGLYAKVRLPVGAPAPTLLVNERSIGTNQSQKFVYTVKPDQTVAYRTVKLGPMIDGKRVIREGVEASDVVIVSGLQRVAAGMTVEPEMAAQ